MPRSDSDGEDVFFDACDDVIIRSSSELDSLSSVGCSTSEDGYDLWAGELISVKERRQRFLRGMGFLEPGPPGTVFPQCLAEITTDCSFQDYEGTISSVCSSFRSCFSDNISAMEDSVNCTMDVDNARTSTVQEGQYNFLSEIIEEVGSDEPETVLGLSYVVRKFSHDRFSHDHDRGARIASCPKQSEFKSLRETIRRIKNPARFSLDDVHPRSLNSGTLYRTKVHQQNKNWMDFTAVYMCQEFQAHKGLIRVMKFSSSGWYLASGGEDCVVRIWQIKEIESTPSLYGKDTGAENMNNNKDVKNKALAIIPDKIFSITETPLQEFHGHTSDILDLAWSKSDFLLTSSKDNTIRMWKVGCDHCLALFKHVNYVTCVQFNPVDERYFISGSIDGKVRIWDVSDKQLYDYYDIKDIITAISYQPDGKGFVVGNVKGRCFFYNKSDRYFGRSNKIRIKRRNIFAAANKITNIQFSKGNSPRMIISSKDHKIRVSEDLKITQKLQGKWSSKALVPPSLTPDGRYLISAGGDSKVRIWNFDDKKKKKAVCSRELFFSEGVTAVASWSRPTTTTTTDGGDGAAAAVLDAPTLCRDRKRCKFGTWFAQQGPDDDGGATWPEERLLPMLRHVSCAGVDGCSAKVAAAWNVVVLTGSNGGVIRAFHNFGLPSSKESALSSVDRSTSEAGHDLWTCEPMSVNERKQEFLKEMGFLESGPNGTIFPRWLPEITTDCSFHEFIFRSCFSSNNVLATNYTRDVENRMISTTVQEGKHNVLPEILQEVASDEMLSTPNEPEVVLRSSRLVQKFSRDRLGHDNARSARITSSPKHSEFFRLVKQSEFKSLWEIIRTKRTPARTSMDDINSRILNSGRICSTKIYQHNKKWMDFTVVYMCQQEFQAHKGLIRVMKFSSSGWHLASGGEDCAVRVWQIKEIESRPDLYDSDTGPKDMDNIKGVKNQAVAIMPNKRHLCMNFKAIQVISWIWHGQSQMKHLLTSSKDRTIRMWKVGCDDCLAVFKHGNYVTCVQFNPVDERYFISGSIDGKVRVWDVSDKILYDYYDIKDSITAISYQPDGKGFIVGNVKGRCLFYDQFGRYFERGKLMRLKRRKWCAAANEITNIHFSKGNSPMVIVASKDHKIQAYEDLKITQEFQGKWRSKALVPPSLTPDGRYLISAGSDSKVRIWNFDDVAGGGKKKKAVCSRELFFSEGVTAVAPWSRPTPTPTTTTDGGDGAVEAAARNVVVVTGSSGGVIRAFHNYGLPPRL
uniref:Uncharacterized protein n=1 Tax=Leersia perrieri TaxID=77586 RepID=A0A0D9VGT6_9ORYZ